MRSQLDDGILALEQSDAADNHLPLRPPSSHSAERDVDQMAASSKQQGADYQKLHKSGHLQVAWNKKSKGPVITLNTTSFYQGREINQFI